MLEKNMTLKQVEWLFCEVLITEEEKTLFWNRFHTQCVLLGD